jgi:dynein heavy chain
MLSPQVQEPNFRFGGVADFPIPRCASVEEYLKAIEGMPVNQPSQLFGFHPNAEIVKDINASEELLRNTLVVSQGNIGYSSR